MCRKPIRLRDTAEAQTCVGTGSDRQVLLRAREDEHAVMLRVEREPSIVRLPSPGAPLTVAQDPWLTSERTSVASRPSRSDQAALAHGRRAASAARTAPTARSRRSPGRGRERACASTRTRRVLARVRRALRARARPLSIPATPLTGDWRSERIAESKSVRCKEAICSEAVVPCVSS